MQFVDPFSGPKLSLGLLKCKLLQAIRNLQHLFCNKMRQHFTKIIYVMVDTINEWRQTGVPERM